jgi:hypothetical protein
MRLAGSCGERDGTSRLHTRTEKGEQNVSSTAEKAEIKPLITLLDQHWLSGPVIACFLSNRVLFYLFLSFYMYFFIIIIPYFSFL